ncbi:unnamed protein product [Linum trigynum]|uniref:Uncharacterized protein n=1 Tax=Linum trigynum TaxID=586398 RepID=A0AAV2E9Q9_9ROSI
MSPAARGRGGGGSSSYNLRGFVELLRDRYCSSWRRSNNVVNISSAANSYNTKPPSSSGDDNGSCRSSADIAKTTQKGLQLISCKNWAERLFLGGWGCKADVDRIPLPSSSKSTTNGSTRCPPTLGEQLQAREEGRDQLQALPPRAVDDGEGLGIFTGEEGRSPAPFPVLPKFRLSRQILIYFLTCIPSPGEMLENCQVLR